MDSYDPVKGEIVERKATQLSKVEGETAKKLRESACKQIPSWRQNSKCTGQREPER